MGGKIAVMRGNGHHTTQHGKCLGGLTLSSPAPPEGREEELGERESFPLPPAPPPPPPPPPPDEPSGSILLSTFAVGRALGSVCEKKGKKKNKHSRLDGLQK